MPRESYAKWNYDSFDATGLKELTQAMGRFKVRVVSIDGSNKPVRSGGVQTKRAVLALSDGQSITLQVTSEGAVYQVRLNSRVIPVRASESIDDIARELSAAVKNNRASFKEKMAKQAEKALPKKRIQAAKSSKKQLEDLNKQNAELESQLVDLRVKAQEVTVKNSELDAEIQSKESELKAIKDETKALQGELNQTGVVA